jgi:hypothetical protein
MILIKTSTGYITRKGFSTDFTITNNINLAYCFDNRKQAEQFIKMYKDNFQGLTIEEVK